MDAITLLYNGTMEAAAKILMKTKTKDEINAQKLTDDLRKTLKDNLENVLEEWKQAVEANVSELWLREYVNAQCNELALKALKNGGWIS